jgi:hypothetical protein
LSAEVFGVAGVRAVDDNRQQAIARTLARIRRVEHARLPAELTLDMSLGLHVWHPPLDRTVKARAAIEWMRRILRLDVELRTDEGVPRLAFGPG